MIVLRIHYVMLFVLFLKATCFLIEIGYRLYIQRAGIVSLHGYLFYTEAIPWFEKFPRSILVYLIFAGWSFLSPRLTSLGKDMLVWVIIPLYVVMCILRPLISDWVPYSYYYQGVDLSLCAYVLCIAPSYYIRLETKTFLRESGSAEGKATQMIKWDWEFMAFFILYGAHFALEMVKVNHSTLHMNALVEMSTLALYIWLIVWRKELLEKGSNFRHLKRYPILGRCSVVSKRFNSLLLVEDVYIKIDKVVTIDGDNDDNPYSSHKPCSYFYNLLKLFFTLLNPFHHIPNSNNSNKTLLTQVSQQSSHTPSPYELSPGNKIDKKPVSDQGSGSAEDNGSILESFYTNGDGRGILSMGGEQLRDFRAKPFPASAYSRRTQVPASIMKLRYAPYLELWEGMAMQGETLVAIKPSGEAGPGETKKEVESFVSGGFVEPFKADVKTLVKRKYLLEMNGTETDTEAGEEAVTTKFINRKNDYYAYKSFSHFHLAFPQKLSSDVDLGNLVLYTSPLPFSGNPSTGGSKDTVLYIPIHFEVGESTQLKIPISIDTRDRTILTRRELFPVELETFDFPVSQFRLNPSPIFLFTPFSVPPQSLEMGDANDNENGQGPMRTSLKDHMFPKMTNRASCIVLPPTTGQFELRNTLINSLPKFSGGEDENPYAHVRDLDDLMFLQKYRNESEMEAMKLVLFPFSLLGKAKSWLQDLRPKSITSFEMLTEAFYNKFFSLEKTETLRRAILWITQLHGESLKDYLERYKGLILQFPHHGIDSWVLTRNLYDGLDAETKKTVKSFYREIH
ncbi:hypothetical protein GIB67_010051 [Kingdonia uniflora]|uniref:Retrotransposon gag domain-containing protein n=1 Tax=Kingdonia uniflora TaxID=39325 RepID=A0A7J7KVA9_9MAGN|nr:hypothetical protein GIB67_010051 [Kingdonia uniflora]